MLQRWPRVVWSLALLIFVACSAEPDDASIDPINAPVLAPQASALGAECNASNPCPPGAYCSRGICCDSPCAGPCLSCLSGEKADLSASGTCGPTYAGSIPKSACSGGHGVSPECAEQLCNGYGLCAKAPGAPCGTPSCSLGLLIAGACDKVGFCEKGNASCVPFACVGSACTTSCTSNSHCASTAFCDSVSGKCVTKKPKGAPCAAAGDCQVNLYCSDGVCCDQQCDATCKTCLAVFKESGNDGVCGNVRAGLDPANQCNPLATDLCLFDGSCDGQGACAKASATTPCGDVTCSEVSGAAEVSGQLCNGAGTCMAVNSVPCVGYAHCDGTQCPTTCSTHADCASGYQCFAVADEPSKKCREPLPNGAVCEDDDECGSLNCSNQVCCNVDCDGVCQSCRNGTCLPVIGEPLGDLRCPGGSEDNPCLGRTCDGKDPTTCQGFVGVEVICGPASCGDNKQISAGTCDGKGMCKVSSASCNGLACDGLVCKTHCATDADCVSGATCDPTTGQCSLGSSCQDDVTVKDLNGKPTDCAPFRCVGGNCTTSCASNDECAPDFLCDRAKGICNDAGSPLADPDVPSCGCRTTAPTRDFSAFWLGLLLLAARIRRR